MRDIIRRNKWFFVPYFIFLLANGILLISFSRVDIHWVMNQFNHPFADWFFKVYTHFGDGIMVGLLIVILLFVRYRYAISLAIGSISIIILVQGLKRFILPDVDRPALVFYHLKKLHFVEDVTVHTSHSFPSGHSATGFAVFLMLSLLSQNNYLKLSFFILASLIAFSRIYLSQHFLVDTYFGSLIGVVSVTLTFWWVNHWKGNKLDQSLRTIFVR